MPHEVDLIGFAVTQNMIDHPPDFPRQHPWGGEIVGGVEHEDVRFRPALDSTLKRFVLPLLIDSPELVVGIGGEPGNHLVPVVGVSGQAVDENDGALKGSRFMGQGLGGALDGVDSDGIVRQVAGLNRTRRIVTRDISELLNDGASGYAHESRIALDA